MPGIDTYTKLLLHMNGTNNSTVFTDSSIYGKTVTRNGSSVVSTAQSKFGGASGSFPSAGVSHLDGDYLTVATGISDFSFGTQPGTIDCWVRFLDIEGNNRHDIWSADTTDTTWMVFAVVNRKLIIWMSSNGTSWDIASGQTGTATLSNNIWYHLAMVWDGATYKFYVNGALDKTITSSLALSAPVTYLVIAKSIFPLGPYQLKGYMDEFRVSKGIARWTSNFTPPINPYSSRNNLLGVSEDSIIRINNINLSTVDKILGVN